VLADDDFSTLVEALVEGRGFSANMRRSLGLLLGGNLGELGLIVGASVAGLPSPLTTRRLLAVNMVTDVLPAVAPAIQEPEHRNLSGLAREGATGLDEPLREDILVRGTATAVPSLAAYLAARRIADPVCARSVAFASIVATRSDIQSISGASRAASAPRARRRRRLRRPHRRRARAPWAAALPRASRANRARPRAHPCGYGPPLGNRARPPRRAGPARSPAALAPDGAGAGG
jgi:hypothetical protein